MDNQVKKKRGRPPLSADEKEARRAANIANAAAFHKRTGYAAQKKYKASHPEIYKGRYYEPKIRIPIDKKDSLAKLIEQTGLTITELFVGAAEEKYGVILHKTVDK